MEKEELLRNAQWYIANIQNDLYAIIYDYMHKNKLKKKDIAEKLGVSKGYITQILKGNFDHKVSKLVDISLAFGKAPIVVYPDLEQYIKAETCRSGSQRFSLKDMWIYQDMGKNNFQNLRSDEPIKLESDSTPYSTTIVKGGLYSVPTRA